jgi:hypothetical protein
VHVGGGKVWELLEFLSLLHIWVYFCCCREGCFYQGLQGAKVVYSRLVSGW